MTDFTALSALEIIRHIGELPACFVRRCEVAAGKWIDSDGVIVTHEWLDGAKALIG